MAGSAPPPDGPPPSDTASSDQGFPPGPAAAQLCGFTLPTQFALPPISLPSLASLITIPKLQSSPESRDQLFVLESDGRDERCTRWRRSRADGSARSGRRERSIVLNGTARKFGLSCLVN